MNWFDWAKGHIAELRAQEAAWGPSALKVFEFAGQAARQLDHNYCGTEHLLIGIMKLNSGVGFNLLRDRGLNLENVRSEVLKLKGLAPGNCGARIPYTPRAKGVIAFARDEAKRLGHLQICSEHLLLALLKESDGPGAAVLAYFHVDIERTQRMILDEISAEKVQPSHTSEGNQKDQHELATTGAVDLPETPVVRIVLDGVGEFPATEQEQKYLSALLSKHPELSPKDCLAWFYMSRCLQFARGSVTRSTGQGQHVSAHELLVAGRLAAMNVFGEKARDWLTALGISSSRSFGDYVYHLIRLGALNAQEGDKPEDFHVTSDLDDFLRTDQSTGSV